MVQSWIITGGGWAAAVPDAQPQHSEGGQGGRQPRQQHRQPCEEGEGREADWLGVAPGQAGAAPAGQVVWGDDTDVADQAGAPRPVPGPAPPLLPVDAAPHPLLAPPPPPVPRVVVETVKGVVAGGATVVVMVAVMVTVVIAVVVAIVISVVVVVIVWLCWPLPSGPRCPGGCGGESGSDDDSSGGGGGGGDLSRLPEQLHPLA